MAGMLPGVEAARRRRFHHTNNLHSELSPMRRTSFCLHAITSYESHSNLSMRNIISNQQRQQQGLCDDENRLCAAAREAKKRLDQRFQPQKRFHQTNGAESRITSTAPQRSSIPVVSQSDYVSKPQGAKPNKWLKLIRMESLEQDECAVCLEHLRAGGKNIIQVACGHRFHTKCLVPWLEGNINNAHCPCCRMEIPC